MTSTNQADEVDTVTSIDETAPCGWVVAIGCLFVGFEFFGPFATWDEASEWADAEAEVAAFFALKDPKEETEGESGV